MAFSKYSILIVEDDSHVSRVLRNHLEETFQNVRVTIAGSAAKAREINQKFPPHIIIWDGAPNERGTTEEYLNCIPEALWSRVVPISIDPLIIETARARGSHAPISKNMEALNTWSDQLVSYLRKIMPRKKK